MLQIRFGDVHIFGRPLDGRPLDGLYVVKNGFEGWDDGTDARREQIPRPGQHGEFDLPVLQGARVVSISGVALAPSKERLEHLRSVVTGLGATGDRLQLTVAHRGETRWAVARRGGKPQFTDSGRIGRRLRASIFLQFVCADPRQYGETRLFGPAAAIGAHHRGNFSAFPVLTVAGASAGGYTVNGPDGRRYIVTTPLVAGTPHTIDMATGRLRIGGTTVIGGVSRSQTWTIPPGREVSMSVTAGTLAAAVPDTFV